MLSPVVDELKSDASKNSLNLHGGPMNDDKIREFKKNPNLKEIVAIHFLNEAGKNENMKTPTFSHFAPMTQTIVDQHSPFRDQS